MIVIMKVEDFNEYFPSDNVLPNMIDFIILDPLLPTSLPSSSMFCSNDLFATYLIANLKVKFAPTMRDLMQHKLNTRWMHEFNFEIKKKGKGKHELFLQLQ